MGKEGDCFKVEMSHRRCNIMNKKDKIGKQSSPVFQGNNHAE